MSRKTIISLVVTSVVLIVGTVILLVYNRRKKIKGETVGQSVVSAVSSAVKLGYIKEYFPLKKGMYGDKVRILQQGLLFKGISVGVAGSDGLFGSSTLAGVRAAFNDPNKTQVTETEWNDFNTLVSSASNLYTGT
ncbi:MAG: hypothetical protein LBG80_00260 [Bacteroidales bacterium]|nr:hypothetical protein [Bacteroidales bacterium]